MAKPGFSGFKWNPSGYRAAQNSAAVQSVLFREAKSREGAANARVNAHGHTGSHFQTEQVRGRFANGYVVHPATHEGYVHASRDGDLR